MVADSSLKPGASRIDLAETSDFDLGELRVRPAHRQVHMNGECRELEPRVAQVLVALASARPNVVSRDRLIEQCWNGRIVGDDAISRCIQALRHLSREFAPEPFVIETVPRVGYALVERPAGAVPPKVRLDKSKAAIVALLVLALIAAGFAFAWSRLAPGQAAPASIAMLPFRNLSAGDPYFAEGVGEEILAQLSREPQFRVVGRASSRQFGVDPDVRRVGRLLGVEYVLEGSVRTQGGRVRVNAGLIRASDAMRLWSDSYDGKLDDIFAIQQRIGGAVAGALKRKLLRAPLSGPLTTSGDVYNIYLVARGLLRTREPAKLETAADLLRRAIEIDPGYAPAWSSLAAATWIRLLSHDIDVAQRLTKGQEAHRYARHALKLAPNLAEAHGTLGMVLGFRSPEAERHIRQAAQLDPNSAENMFWVGNIYANAADFERQLAAYRRAAQLDPLLVNVSKVGPILALEMGHFDEARAWVRRRRALDPLGGRMGEGWIAFAAGDFSRAVMIWAAVEETARPPYGTTAKQLAGETLRMLGLLDAGQAGRFDGGLLRLWMERPPSPAVWHARYSNQAVDSYPDSFRHSVATKLLLNAGRQRELVPYYDRDTGLLRLSSKQRPAPIDLAEAADLVALALRGSGRGAEADRLLTHADAAIKWSLRRGRVPFWFDAAAAEVWAVQGKQDQALAALERAVDRGWTHSRNADLHDIAHEPAFRALRGNPRFERLRARLAAHRDRERVEAERLMASRSQTTL